MNELKILGYLNLSLTKNTRDIYKQLENDEFDVEIKKIALVLELIKFSRIPLLYMTQEIQKTLNFTEERLKLTVWQSHGKSLMFVLEKYF